MYYAYLPARGLLSLTGDDLIAFLQGLITNDARKLERGQALYAALLSPQGKYLHDFFLIPQGGRVLLDGEKHRLADLKQRLSLYKLRSKVAIELLPDSEGVVALWGGVMKDAKNNDIIPDPRIAALGWRMVGDVTQNIAWCEAQGFTRADAIAYDKHRIQHGVPDGSRDMTPDKSLMLEFNMDVLNAVDFAKGCYVGQEVTARSKYRAQLRKTLCVIDTSGALPAAGTVLMNNEKEIGQMLSSAGNTGLALMRTEALTPDGAMTLADGTAVRIREIFARG